MKCVVKESIFETSKITSMRKLIDFLEITIEFDNGISHHHFYDNEEELESEWLRIMKCWRYEEETDGVDIPHTC